MGRFLFRCQTGMIFKSVKTDSPTDVFALPTSGIAKCRLATLYQLAAVIAISSLLNWKKGGDS